MKLLFLIATCAWAQIEQPRIGVMLDPAGDARPVSGAAGSAVTQGPIARGVASLACSGDRCAFRKTKAVIAFGVDSVYVYEAGRLSRNGAPVSISVTGEILSIREANNVLEFAVRREDGVWIVRDGDIVVNALPDADGPVLLAGETILFASGNETVVLRPDGSRQNLPLRPGAFLRMSNAYAQIRSGRTSYAVQLSTGRFFVLAEAP